MGMSPAEKMRRHRAKKFIEDNNRAILATLAKDIAAAARDAATRGDLPGYICRGGSDREVLEDLKEHLTGQQALFN